MNKEIIENYELFKSYYYKNGKDILKNALSKPMPFKKLVKNGYFNTEIAAFLECISLALKSCQFDTIYKNSYDNVIDFYGGIEETLDYFFNISMLINSREKFNKIYFISKERFDFFKNLKPIENFLDIEILIDFLIDLPILILLDNNKLISLNLIQEKGSLNSKKIGVTFFEKEFNDFKSVYYFDIPIMQNDEPINFKDLLSAMIDIYSSDFYILNQSKDDLYGIDFFRFLLNFLLALKSNNLKPIEKEYNPKRINYIKNIKSNYKVGRSKNMLKKIPCYKFIDIDIHLDQLEKQEQAKYYKNNNLDLKGIKSHWRAGHFHSYWTGEKKSGNQKKIIKFIPDLWVGDPSQIQEKPTIIRKIKANQK